MMKKIAYIFLFALLIGGISSCSNKLCPAYGTYPRGGRR